MEITKVSFVAYITIIIKIEAGTKPPTQTKEGLEFEFFLKFQSFLLRVKLSCSCMLHIFS